MSWGPEENTIEIVHGRVEIRIRVDQEGYIYRDFSVQLIYKYEGQHYPVVRYDCSHGTEPHRDILSWSGSTMTKTYMRQGISRTQAFEEAFDEVYANWERYVDDFVRRRP